MAFSSPLLKKVTLRMLCFLYFAWKIFQRLSRHILAPFGRSGIPRSLEILPLETATLDTCTRGAFRRCRREELKNKI